MGMIKFYLASVVVWMIIMAAALLIAKDGAFKNGWFNINEKGSRIQGFGKLACIAAIPVVRALITIFIFFMMAIKKDDTPSQNK